MPVRLPILKPQELPLGHPESVNMFRSGPDKPLLATRGAIEVYTREVVLACWALLRDRAEEHNGLDYLQVFESHDDEQPDLWFIEDGDGGAITALLPSEH